MRRSVSLLLLASLALLLLSGAAALGAGRRGRDWDGAVNRGLRLRQGDGQLRASSKDSQPQFLTQRLDHFDALNSATFQQLFFVNDSYYNPSAPLIFLMVGGEGPISSAYIDGHFHMSNLAKRFGALQVTLEHRFYGQSVPNNDSSTPNLRFLSSQQALEDLAAFHSYISDKYDPSARWVVFGGSYPGSLSAWARAKYPHLFHASFSASAPVLAQLNFIGYLEVVDLSVGDACSQRIRDGMSTLSSLLATADGQAKLVSMFNLCAAPASKLDAADFIEMLVDPIAEQVQYNLDAGKPYDITAMCQRLLKPADPVQPLIDMWQQNYGGSSSECVDASYAGLVQQLSETGAMRSWTWQTCTEFGYFQSGESPDQPFPATLSLDYFLAQCRDAFGLSDSSFQAAIDRTNNYYGGIDIVTSNTFFTQGTIDPWHRLGAYHAFPAWDYSTSVLINGTAHCADMYQPQVNDLPGLADVRQQQAQFLQKWLAQPQSSGAKRNSKRKLAEF